MENVVGVLKDSIGKELMTPMFDLSQEYAEIGIDKLLDNSAFKELPVVKTIIGLYKGGLAVRELVFARKLAIFFQQFHRGLDKQEDRQEVLYDLQSNPIKRDKIVEQVIVMNERYIHTTKSCIHANLLLAHLFHKLTWDELSDLLICLDGLHPKSLERLQALSVAEKPFWTEDIGLPFDAPLNAVGLASQRFSCYIINDLGRKLYYYGMVGDIDSYIPPYENANEY